MRIQASFKDDLGHKCRGGQSNLEVNDRLQKPFVKFTERRCFRALEQTGPDSFAAIGGAYEQSNRKPKQP